MSRTICKNEFGEGFEGINDGKTGKTKPNVDAASFSQTNKAFSVLTHLLQKPKKSIEVN